MQFFLNLTRYNMSGVTAIYHELRPTPVVLARYGPDVTPDTHQEMNRDSLYY